MLSKISAMKKTIYLIFFLTLFLNTHFLSAQCAGTGIIASAAGTTVQGYSGDGGLGALAKINQPLGLAGDANGNMYFADAINHIVRKVDANGIISTVAGIPGVSGFNSASGSTDIVQLSYPTDVAVGPNGNLYIAEGISSLIRKVNLTTNIVTLIGGTPVNGFGYAGDGGNATDAKLQFPNGLVVNSGGDIFIADRFNHRIRKIAVDGIITTIAGNGVQGYSGDGANAINAELDNPLDIAIDASDNIYFIDSNNNVIRKIDAITNVITTEIGSSTLGFSGDGGLANAATINNPQGISIDSHDNIYISDQQNARIRKIDANTGIINSILGNGATGYPVSGTAANVASINPYNLYVDTNDKLFFSEWINHRIVTVNCPETELFYEAECVTVGSNWQTYSDTRASNGQCLIYPGIGKKLAAGPSNNDDIIRFLTVVPEAGMYDLYARVLTFSSFNDAFWVRVNNSNWMDFSNLQKSFSFQWNQLHDGDINSPISLSLNSGLNIIEFGLGEDGTRLDKVAVVAAGLTPPEALGGSADNCSGVLPDNDDGYDLEETNHQTKGISVYPNPFNATLSIDWTSELPTDIKILNTFGQTVWQKNGVLSMNDVINLEAFPAGMYIIELENEEERKAMKVQKINR